MNQIHSPRLHRRGDAIPAHVQAIIDNAADTIPVNVEKVAKALGLRVFSTNLPDKVSGMLLRDKSYESPSGFVIFVEKNEPAVRQRFTAAHELGHFVLHKDSVGDKVTDNYLLRSDGMSNRQEVEANQFAADLLMPMDQVTKAMGDGITTPKELARRFDVSEVAMSIRLGLVT